ANAPARLSTLSLHDALPIWHAEAEAVAAWFDLHAFQAMQQGFTPVPRGRRRTPEHVVALERRQRDAGDMRNAELCRQIAVAAGDGVEDVLAVTDQIHLVHRQDYIADSQQRDDIAVAPRLRQQPPARVDQHHGEIGGGGTRGHVAGVLLVPRTICDDELALLRTEESVGDVDGDA